MIKAIIFDMDGLMVDTEIISYMCYKEIIESYHIHFTKEDYIQSFPGRPLMSSLHMIKDQYKIDYDENEKVKEFHQLEEKYMNKDGVALKKGLIELLHYLQKNNYKTIIATSSLKQRAYKILEKHDVLKYFDDIVYGNEVQHGKPCPDIFLKACEKLNVHTSEALVLEDSEAGIQAAYDAHIRVICIPDLKQPREEYKEKTEHIFHSLEDVMPYLDEQNI